MIKLLLFLFLTIALAMPVHAQTAKIYVWRNESGVLVFSDAPRPDAEELKTKPGNIIQSSTSVDTEVLDITPQKMTEAYEIVINTPKNHTTIRDNTGSIYIAGDIKPRFKNGLEVQLLLDGEPYKAPQNHSMFSLRNIDRGAHTIKMLLLNEEGKVIASSTSVTFYMHRASIN
ncbi:DUF4124 domain-containing protein [Colwellia ponticola]|uniref:DUF4124 domain-containing protein n=1 Tax=Colwellia ponticola TaxID=2304625 RepID=A0A8H2PJK1_9GAMM|nr:DUF4124 domain-containing protein [Colwellia ponticola]TMM43893.1 DUF4124 domain-containing protein [Colwellia ponticola]